MPIGPCGIPLPRVGPGAGLRLSGRLELETELSPTRPALGTESIAGVITFVIGLGLVAVA